MRVGCTAAAVLLVALATAACTSPEDAPTASRTGTPSTSPSRDVSSEVSEREVPPPPVRSMELGAKPKLAYVDADMIVTPGGARIASPLGDTFLLHSDNGVPLVYGLSKGGRSYPVYQVVLRSGGSLRLLTDDGSKPVISADGRFVAWHVAESPEGYARVAGWDLQRRTPLANTATFPFKPTCCDNPLVLHAIDTQGRVYASGATGTWLAPLRSGVQVTAIQGLPRWHYIESVAGNGSILASNGPAIVGRLRSGVFVESRTRIAAGAGGSFSATGESLAYVDRYGSLRVRDLISGDVKTIPPPAGSRFVSVAWEDSSNVLLETVIGASGRRTAWVRCSVDGLSCAIALPPDRAYTFPN